MRMLQLPFRIISRMQHCGMPKYRERIGTREIVGPGINNTPIYYDWVAFPYPAIRYKELTPELIALREKEKSDWSQLTIEEKKELYRASFCQTFSEMKAPTGEWKSVIGWGLVLCSIGLWYFLAMCAFLHTDLPETLNEDRRRAQLRRMLDLRVDPIDGLSSEWDYEKEEWKPKSWMPKFYW